MRTARKFLGVVTVLALAAVVGIVSCGKDSKPAVTAETKTPDAAKGDDGKADMAKVSYCLGLGLGRNAKTSDVAVDVDQFVEGLKAGLDGSAAKVTEEEMQKIMAAFQQEMMMKQMEKMRAAAEENRKKGEAFLMENKAKEGVKVTASGLQYKVLNAGTGRQATLADTVTVQYKGTLIDGTEFDSTFKAGEPAQFVLSRPGVIPGWIEALQLMKEGDKFQVVIPSDLAYGERGAGGGAIAPNSVLIFEVEVTKVENTPKEEAPKEAPKPEEPKKEEPKKEEPKKEEAPKDAPKPDTK